MFTTIDKAIAGLISSVLSLLVLFKVLPVDLATPEIVSAVSAAITGIVVWAVPNKEPS